MERKGNRGHPDAGAQDGQTHPDPDEAGQNVKGLRQPFRPAVDDAQTDDGQQSRMDVASPCRLCRFLTLSGDSGLFYILFMVGATHECFYFQTKR